MSQEPTLDDYNSRVRRLLQVVRSAHYSDHERLRHAAAREGKAPHIYQRYNREMTALARTRLVEGMEIALSELTRLSSQTSLDGEALRQVTGTLIEEFLMQLKQEACRFAPPGASLDGLGELTIDVLREFDRGLYLMPGEPRAPVTINITNVRDAQVGAILQSGNGTTQRHGFGE